MSDSIEKSAVSGIIDQSARSLVDRVKQEHGRIDSTLDMAIPRWGGYVVARYRRITKPALLAANRAKGVERANARALASACQEIFVVDPDSGSLIPAREADGKPGAIRFDSRLADLFELGGDTQEQIVLAMYADEVALAAHTKRLMDWQTGANLEDLTVEEVEELAGEE